MAVRWWVWWLMVSGVHAITNSSTSPLPVPSASPSSSPLLPSVHERSVSAGLLEEGLLSLGFVVVASALLVGLMLVEQHTFARTFAEDDRRRQREQLLSEPWDGDLSVADPNASDTSESEDEDIDVGGAMAGDSRSLRDVTDESADEESPLSRDKRRSGRKAKAESERDVKPSKMITIKNIFKKRKKAKLEDEPTASLDDEVVREMQSRSEQARTRRGTRRRTGSWLMKMKWGTEDEDSMASSSGEFSVQRLDGDTGLYINQLDSSGITGDDLIANEEYEDEDSFAMQRLVPRSPILDTPTTQQGGSATHSPS